MTFLARARLVAAGLVAAAAPLSSPAVYVAADGLGQALIYPYYTVRSADGGAFNTYVSVVNHAADTKVLRVQFREGRVGDDVLDFTVILGPNDTWTAGLVASTADPASPARLITADASCTFPAIPAEGVDFRDFRYVQESPFAGTGLERTREGWIEVFEMGTRVGANAASGCAALEVVNPSSDVGPPTGGISGTVALINVARGVDFALNAQALAQLSRVPIYRGVGSELDFDTPGIEPVSDVIANGYLYRSTWPRPADAVSAALMRFSWITEFMLDAATRSHTEVVMTFPTRRNHVTRSSASAPFTRPAASPADCTQASGETVAISWYDREARGGQVTNQDTVATLCPASAVIDIRNDLPVTTLPVPAPGAGTAVLGSVNRGLGGSALSVDVGVQNGWLAIRPGTGGANMFSLAGSTRTDLATGEVVEGVHFFVGLPVVGFSVRTLDNGTLSCASAGSAGDTPCQGTYGSAFAFKYRPSVVSLQP